MTRPRANLGEGRTLPVRVEPVPGEAFDSWTERLAAGLRVEHGTALFAIGAASSPRWDGFAGFWNVMVAAEQLEEIARRCRLGVDKEAGMLLASYDGRALDCSVLALGDGASYRSFVQRSHPRFLSGSSRACPGCLADDDGAWLLSWRLPWSFACRRHRCLLIDDCPGCRRPLRRPERGANRARFIGQVPRPGHCTNPAPALRVNERAARPCGHDLRGVSAVSLDGGETVLDAQQLVDAVLRDGTASLAGRPLSAHDFYHDLAILVRLVLRLAEPDDRPVADLLETGPSMTELFARFEHERNTRPLRTKTALSSATMAVAMAVALPIVAAPDPESAITAVRWLIDSVYRQRRATAGELRHNWGRPGPVLSSLLDEGFRRSLGLRGPRPRTRR